MKNKNLLSFSQMIEKARHVKRNRSNVYLDILDHGLANIPSDAPPTINFVKWYHLKIYPFIKDRFFNVLERQSLPELKGNLKHYVRCQPTTIANWWVCHFASWRKIFFFSSHLAFTSSASRLLMMFFIITIILSGLSQMKDDFKSLLFSESSV